MVAIALSPSPYEILSTSIKESFTAIDRFEWQVCNELGEMRDRKLYTEAGYKNFEEYCNNELQQWGGHRRVNQLIGAAIVVETLKDTEFDGVIKRESHARPLLRLVKQPEKLKQAVAIACQETSAPIAATFKKAVEIVEPKEQKPKLQEQLFLKGTKVQITEKLHPNFGECGVVASDIENSDIKTIELNTGERIRAYKKEIAVIDTTPIERRYPPEYQEAIAQLEAQHKKEIERLEAEIAARIKAEAEEKAIASVENQLKAAQAIASQKSLEIAKLQQRVDELESLRTLAAENEVLKREIDHLKELGRIQSQSRWQNTGNKEADKAINSNVKKLVESLEPELHLRQMAIAPPQGNPRETVTLLGLSLTAMASGHPKFATELRKAAAIILGVDEASLDAKKEQLEQLPQAIASIRYALSRPDVDWKTFSEVVDHYNLIKQETWLELTPHERERVNQLSAEFYVVGRVAWSDSLLKKVRIKQVNQDKTVNVSIAESAEIKTLPFTDIKPIEDIDFPEPPAIQVGSRVSASDHYSQLYIKAGTVIQEFDDGAFMVHWDDCDRPLLRHRYESHELRVV